jgi:uncharacterized repeat protein (TIGR03803 family)
VYGDGAVFSILADGKSETMLHSFGYGKDGNEPLAPLLAETLGGTLWLFGTTAAGGDGYGTIFEMDPSGKEKWVKSFEGYNGEYPASPLIYYPFNVNAQLWGTTETGDNQAASAGTAFATGVKAGTVIDTFYFFGSEDGAIPTAGLTYVMEQNLFYGTTVSNSIKSSSPYGYGTVFAFMGPPHQGEAAWVFSFNGQDGAYPFASLIFNGLLWGTTYEGGAYGDGTVFSIGTDGTAETVLHSFGKGSDGVEPLAGLVDVNNTLYGTTTEGGKHSEGTVFALTP